jgi:hypothetical protein
MKGGHTMSGLIIFLVVLVATAIIEVFAQTHGVDSRPDFEDPRAPACGLYT